MRLCRTRIALLARQVLYQLELQVQRKSGSRCWSRTSNLPIIGRVLSPVELSGQKRMTGEHLEHSVGFEPTGSLRSPDLQSGAFSRSAISPE